MSGSKHYLWFNFTCRGNILRSLLSYRTWASTWVVHLLNHTLHRVTAERIKSGKGHVCMHDGLLYISSSCRMFFSQPHARFIVQCLLLTACNKIYHHHLFYNFFMLPSTLASFARFLQIKRHSSCHTENTKWRWN